MMPVGNLVAVGLRQQCAQPQQRELVQDETRIGWHRGKSVDLGGRLGEVGRTAAPKEHFDQRRHGRPTRRHVTGRVEEVDCRPRQFDGAVEVPHSGLLLGVLDVHPPHHVGRVTVADAGVAVLVHERQTRCAVGCV